ncbi:MAG: hydroxymethylpyrimidine/phosphomethylpyrimidine kinase [Pseudomonadota bacterium]
MQVPNHRPCVLCIGGLDPSGGAGVQADIEAIAQCGGHALPIISCLTVQNSSAALSVKSINTKIIKQQAEALFTDIKISAVKIGVTPSEDMVETISDIISQLPEIPIVLDPVISASHGIKFANQSVLDAINELLLPKLTVITPNHSELNQIITKDECITSKAQSLCKLGPQYVFLTGVDEHSDHVINYLVDSEKVLEEYHWPRLPHSYHGSGCTVSSALTCFLAHGLEIVDATDKAQSYTMQALELADRPGQGQSIPKRIFK